MEMQQIEAMIVSGTKKGIAEFLKGMISKLNIFTALQIFWLVELYYLMCNSILSLAERIEIINGNPSIIAVLPVKVRVFNGTILGYFNEWSNFIAILAAILLISGIVISSTKAIPRISDYNLIYRYSGYGVYAFGWLILIFFTYKLFSTSNILFCITIPVIAMISELIKRIKRIKYRYF